jgi:hypothetical protein
MFSDTFSASLGKKTINPFSTESRRLTTLIDVHLKELDEKAIKMSGSKPGLAAYLGCYRGAMKNITEGLDKETQQKYKAQAKKWTEQKPPPQQQQR